MSLLQIHFYDPKGRLHTVLKQPDVHTLINVLLEFTDDHNLVHVERRGDVVEICATNFEVKETQRDKR